MRDGSSVAGKVLVHPDPRVQAVIEQVRERETAQAIDRLRLIHRTVPARVIVLSNARARPDRRPLDDLEGNHAEPS